MKAPLFYLATFILFIHKTSPRPMRSTNHTFRIYKTSSPVLLNARGTAGKIIMDAGFLGIGCFFRKSDCEWTAWRVGISNLYIFGKQWFGTWYFMTLNNNSRFVVEKGEDPADAVTRNDSRLFEYKYPSWGRNGRVLLHKASGCYFTQTMVVDAGCNRDRAMVINMKLVKV